ncbi:MAG: sugar ABC transporter permease, partial [Eisenbergiella massiliensis]|nr:sugar ABC transporter permease [Eisenbergiella massiliensis]
MKNAKRNAAAAVPMRKSLGKQIRRHWEFYLLLLPGIILTIIFKYIPIYGVQIAFRDYNAVDGFLGS